MRSPLLLIIVLSGFFCLTSCKNSNKAHVQLETEHEVKLYHQAIKFGDVGTAIATMQSLLVWDSTKTNYYDTLAVLYYHSQNYAQAIQAAQVIFEKQPDNIKLLQIASHSYQYIGRQDLAIPFYLKIADLQPDPVVHYEIAACYFAIKDYSKMNEFIEKIYSDKKSDTTKVTISFNQGRNEQDIPVKAACYNLLGTLSANEHKNQDAIKQFNEALILSPTFELAKQNLDYVNKHKD